MPAFLDLFSGIGTASLAFRPHGWTCLAHSEIEPFACAVLDHHFPDVPNFGDINRFKEWPDLGTVDLVCGGSPCQSFSIAGLRKGLDDPRGRLMLAFLAVARHYRPRWLVFENVTGILSKDEGRVFATLIRGMEECGYSCAWRVLDAQYIRTQRFPWAVPQRRRRVFVVGYLGDWRYPAAVLFEPESMRGDSPPRRAQGQGLTRDVAQSLVASGRGVERTGEPRGQDDVVAARLVSFGDYEIDGTASPVLERDYKYASDLIAFPTEMSGTQYPVKQGELPSLTVKHTVSIAHTLRGEGFDASEDGTGRGPPLVPIAFDSKTDGSNGEVAPTLRAMDFDDSHANGGGQVAVAYGLRSDASREGIARTPSADAEGRVRLRDPGFNFCEGFAPTLDAGQPHAVAIQERATAENPEAGPDGKGWRDDGAAYTLESRQVPQAIVYPEVTWAVRRLTPLECERLQGLPDRWTDIPWRGKKHTPDGPRYRVIGNAWALNCADWIAARIDAVERSGL